MPTRPTAIADRPAAACSNIAAFSLLGVPASKWGEDEYGEDGSPIVIDEVAGQWIALAGMPVTPVAALLGFVLFRFFDIIKPWPIKWLDQKVHGGFGIMIDDVIAGVFGLIVLQLTAVWLG